MPDSLSKVTSILARIGPQQGGDAGGIIKPILPVGGGIIGAAAEGAANPLIGPVTGSPVECVVSFRVSQYSQSQPAPGLGVGIQGASVRIWVTGSLAPFTVITGPNGLASATFLLDPPPAKFNILVNKSPYSPALAEAPFVQTVTVASVSLLPGATGTSFRLYKGNVSIDYANDAPILDPKPGNGPGIIPFDPFGLGYTA